MTQTLKLMVMVLWAWSVSAREARWFLQRATVTHVVRQQQVLTSLVPSSCVVLEESIKPCRHLRGLLEPTTSSTVSRMLMTGTPRLEGQMPHRPVLSGSLAEPERSWSWFGLSAVTVTQTLTELVTARSVTPAAVVTFSVRGCQPSQLPFGLPLCPPNNTSHSAAHIATARISTTKDLHFVEEEGIK